MVINKMEPGYKFFKKFQIASAKNY